MIVLPAHVRSGDADMGDAGSRCQSRGGATKGLIRRDAAGVHLSISLRDRLHHGALCASATSEKLARGGHEIVTVPVLPKAHKPEVRFESTKSI